MDIKLTDKIAVRVARSKFNTPSIEMRRARFMGGVKRAFMSPGVLSMMYEKGYEVTAIMKLIELEIQGKEPPSSVTIPLNDKKSLHLDAFANRSWVNLQTYKDGELQVGLSFGLNLDEWLAFLAQEDPVKKAVSDLLPNRSSHPEGSEAAEAGPYVAQHRCLVVKRDGSTRVAPCWSFAEEEARQYGHEPGNPVPEDDDRVHIQMRHVKQPRLTVIRDVAQTVLLREAVLRDESSGVQVNCTACEEDQPNQMAHMAPGGCLCPDTADVLYARARDSVTAYQVVALIHEMLHHMGMDKTAAQHIPPTTAAEEEGIKEMVLDRSGVMEVLAGVDDEDDGAERGPLRALCHFILRKQQ